MNGQTESAQAELGISQNGREKSERLDLTQVIGIAVSLFFLFFLLLFVFLFFLLLFLFFLLLFLFFLRLCVFVVVVGSFHLA